MLLSPSGRQRASTASEGRGRDAGGGQMGLRSPICERLGIEVPIVLAGMGQASPGAVEELEELAGPTTVETTFKSPPCRWIS